MPERKIGGFVAIGNTLRGARLVDLTRLHAQVIARDYRPTALKTTVYGMREFSLTDPDGHRLSFGQDGKE